MESEARGQLQAASFVEVASTREALLAGRADVRSLVVRSRSARVTVVAVGSGRLVFEIPR